MPVTVDYKNEPEAPEQEVPENPVMRVVERIADDVLASALRLAFSHGVSPEVAIKATGIAMQVFLSLPPTTTEDEETPE